nr:hypothetical protein CPGR_00527 [Mycolicibacterium malmesburyense]
MPCQSTPACSTKRLSSIETIASFIVLAICSLGTSNRRWVYSQAIGLPAASTIVVTWGTSSSTSCAEPLATTSEARLDNSPNPPANGNISAAASTPASVQHKISLMTVPPAGARSGMSAGY